jgi:hypothetical protein
MESKKNPLQTRKRREDEIIIPIRIVAIPTEAAEMVRKTMRAPFHGFPAHAEMATEDAPCRHCLRMIVAGKDRRILFTYDRFEGVEALPQPGPVYVHEESCPHYESEAGFPEDSGEAPVRWKPMPGGGDC